MIIETSDLSFAYDKKKDNILNCINYTFETGKCYILTGKNGSGKTTLSKLLCGLLTPESGLITIDGQDLRSFNLGDLSNKIGYLFQNPDMQLFGASCIEELSFPYELKGEFNETIKKKIDKILIKFHLNDVKNSFPLLMSGGEKQRLALATIFIRDIEFLILDEPSSAIDNEGRKFLAAIVNEYVIRGGGVLVISHDNALIEMLHNKVLLTLKDGRL